MLRGLTLRMKKICFKCYFLLNIKHGASQLGYIWGARASNSVAPAPWVELNKIQNDIHSKHYSSFTEICLVFVEISKF